MDEHDLSRFCCLNPDCPDHGQRGHGNLTVTARYGPRLTRMLRCRTCHARFSERKGTPLFDSRLPPETVTAVLAHVAEGVGTRKTARLVGVHRDTVTHYTRLAGDHAQHLHDELVAFSPDDDRSAVQREVGLRPEKRAELRAGRGDRRRLLGSRGP